MTNTMSFGPEWIRTLSNNGSNSSVGQTQSTQSGRKLPLAEYRYGKEEMISLYPNPPLYPMNISNIPTIVRQNCIQPLAFIPLTEEEQLALTGNVNSGSVYGGRGRGGYYGLRGGGGGGRGRGRGGRTDYHRSTSGGEDFPDRGGYYRSSSDSAWNEEGRGGYQTRGGGRALRDNNWRSTQPVGEGMEGQGQGQSQTQTTGGWSGGGGGGNSHWNTTSPAKASRVLSKDGGGDHWNPLPEWATDNTKKPVGDFDGKGRFSLTDKDAESDDPPIPESVETKEERNSGSLSPEDVFEEEDDRTSTRNNQPHQASFQDDNQLDEFSDKEDESKEDAGWTHSVMGGQTGNKESRVESVDSMEEMQRRFEKAAEAVLSTEDEDTPSPSPNPAILERQPPPPPPPHTAGKGLDDMQRWVYTDPRGELQGPFTNQEMADWFAAGYFTMDLKIRRSSDVMFLPLGQVIRIWGRVPFTPGPQPPPLQQTEPFWQQMFVQQHQLFSQPQDTTTASSSQPQPQHPTPPITTASVTNDTSPIWGTRMSPEEEQWPDLTGGEPQLQQQPMITQRPVPQEDSEEIMRQKLKMAEEEERQKAELRRLEEERILKMEEQRRKQEEEEKRQREEEDRRRAEEEERQRAIEEERRKRAEQKRKEEEEQLRREAKEREQAEEKKREWEEMHRKLLKQQQLEEEERRLKEQLGIHPLQHQQPHLPQQMPHPSHSTLMQQFMTDPSSYQQQDSTISVWTYDHPNSSAPSLLKIQQEEKVKEKVRHSEERRQQLLLQQQQQHQQLQQQAAASGGWSSPTTPSSKPLSFLEIQQEQEKQFTVKDGGTSGSSSRGNSKKVNAPSAPSPASSWSKIAAASNKSPSSQTPPWGASPHQNPPSFLIPTHQQHLLPPPQKEPKPLSFWEECALETTTTGTTSSVGKAGGTKGQSKDETGRSGRGPIKIKEEEKVRQLFSYSATDDAFTQWCAAELVKFNTDVDAATFVSLLLDVESTYEVHDYIKSFLGETDDVHSFAKQFLERRQKIRNYGQQKKPSGSGGMSDSTSSSVNSTSSSSSSSRSSKKKKKGKMQKMPPSALLGFTVNAAERPNAGEIHSVKDVL